MCGAGRGAPATLDRVRLGRLFSTSLVLALLALPSSAGAAGFDEIFGDYRSDGDLDGCYSPSDLYGAGQQIPPDIEQYAPGFGNALSVSPGCGGGGGGPAPEPADEEVPAPISSGGTSGPAPPPDVTKKAVTEPPAPKAVDPPVVSSLPRPALDTASAVVRSETPGALIALLVAAGVAVLLALGWTVAWLMGWSTERITKPLFATFQTVWDRLIPGR